MRSNTAVVSTFEDMKGSCCVDNMEKNPYCSFWHAVELALWLLPRRQDVQELISQAAFIKTLYCILIHRQPLPYLKVSKDFSQLCKVLSNEKS